MKFRLANPSDSALLARLIAESNKDVATQFGINESNCPKHPSLCKAEWLSHDFARGEIYYIAYEDDEPLGCVATEYPTAELAYLNRLAVLPAHRRQGVGKRLVSYVLEQAHARGVRSVSIGVIGEHVALQRWYAGLGFVGGETKVFPHLPFSVKYMAYTLEAA